MPTLRFGESVSIRIEPGDTLQVVAPAASTAVAFDPLTFNPNVTVTASTSIVGPFPNSRNITLSCTSGAVSYSLGPDGKLASAVVVSGDAPSDGDGRPDGTVYIQTA